MADVENCVSCGDIIPEGRQVCPNCEDIEYRTAKKILEKVYSFTDYNEVGTRYLIRQLAMEYGVELKGQPRMGLNGFEK